MAVNTHELETQFQKRVREQEMKMQSERHKAMLREYGPRQRLTDTVVRVTRCEDVDTKYLPEIDSVGGRVDGEDNNVVDAEVISDAR